MPVIKVTLLECKKCGHTWQSKLGGLPKACPACKNYFWQEAPKRKGIRTACKHIGSPGERQQTCSLTV